MDKLLIQNARVYQDGHFISADVLCVDSLIAKIGQNLEAEDAQVIDAGGMRLAPGLIDVHTHGAAGGLRRSKRAFPGDADSAASGRDDYCERERCEAAVLRGRGTLRALPSNSHKGTEFP